MLFLYRGNLEKIELALQQPDIFISKLYIFDEDKNDYDRHTIPYMSIVNAQYLLENKKDKYSLIHLFPIYTDENQCLVQVLANNFSQKVISREIYNYLTNIMAFDGKTSSFHDVADEVPEYELKYEQPYITLFASPAFAYNYIAATNARLLSAYSHRILENCINVRLSFSKNIILPLQQLVFIDETDALQFIDQFKAEQALQNLKDEIR